MHLSENEGIEGKTLVVTGGLGFVGSALCFELIRRGARDVRAFDLRSSSPYSHLLQEKGVHCIQGDVIHKGDVERALRGADCVFHLAAFGMSGKEMLQFGRVDDGIGCPLDLIIFGKKFQKNFIDLTVQKSFDESNDSEVRKVPDFKSGNLFPVDDVNINGTCHVFDACLDLGVKRLVYCSTYNVVFGGQQIVNGNEALPYFSIDHHADPYGRSKSIAEQFVLKNNARPFKNKTGGCLYTCAIRPAAIYGPGEDRHLPRIIATARLGLLLFRVGDKTVKSDWLFVDNLVLALILASMGLLDDIPGKEKRPVAAGQAYFICDGSPVNTFEFLQPLLRSLGYEIPKTSLSVNHTLVLGKICWVFYTILYPWLNRWWLPQPFILPSEVHKVGVTHYFSYLKAKEEIGYVPMVNPREGMASTIAYWQERKETVDGPSIYAWLFCLLGMISLFCAAFLPGDTGIVSILRAISLFFYRSMWMIRLVFLLSTAAHIIEAIYARHLAKRVDPANTRGWFWQTFALGYFSLRFILKRARK